MMNNNTEGGGKEDRESNGQKMEEKRLWVVWGV